MTEIPDPQVFRAAADVIRTNGWNQGNFFDSSANFYRRADGRPTLPADKCPVCLIGSINVAVIGHPVDVDGEADVERRWLLQFTDDHPAFWNDTEGRTVDEVLALLERAAVEAESARAAADFECVAASIDAPYKHCGCATCAAKRAEKRAAAGGESRG